MTATKKPTYREWIWFLTEINKVDPAECHMSRTEIWGWALIIWGLSGFLDPDEMDAEIAEEIKKRKLGIRKTSTGNTLSIVPKDPT